MEEGDMEPTTQTASSGRVQHHFWSFLTITLLLMMVAKSPEGHSSFAHRLRGRLRTKAARCIRRLVTAVDTATGQNYSTKGDGEGVYNLLDLLPGSYKVTASANGFQAAVFDNVILESAQQRGLNIVLRPGAVTQQVVVTAAGQLLETVDASVGGVIDESKVANMPSTGREVFEDASLNARHSHRSNRSLRFDPSE